jgi:NAD-dependent deacetylase
MSFSLSVTRFLRLYLRGFARVIFADNWSSGLFVIAAASLISLPAALGALLGSGIEVILDCWGGKNDKRNKHSFTGYNGAIFGFIWGGCLARFDYISLLFLPGLATCYLLRRPLEYLFGRFHLLSFASAALISAWAFQYLLHIIGIELFESYRISTFGTVGVLLAFLGITLSLVTISWRVFAASLSLTFLCVLIGLYLVPGKDILHSLTLSSGLWAFSAAPASIGMHAVFPRGSSKAITTGVVATAIAAIVWIIWKFLFEEYLLDPLMAPAFIGIWLSTLIFTFRNPVVRNPATRAIVELLLGAKTNRNLAVALTGAGLSTSSGIPDYVSGNWLKSGVEPTEYSYNNFLESRDSRLLYWDSCQRFKDTVKNSIPNQGHKSLALLEKSNLLSCVITQNVDGLHQLSGSRDVIELHGTLEHLKCLNCKWQGKWPVLNAWQLRDITCPTCEAFVKPAVVAFGEDIPLNTWAQSVEKIDICSILLVIGTRLSVSSARTLVTRARTAGAQIIIVNSEPTSMPIHPEDIVVYETAENCLSAISSLIEDDILKIFKNVLTGIRHEVLKQ